MTVAEDLLRTMSAQGMRITEQRKSLVALFIENKGYLSAKDVYIHLERLYPGVSFDTIYRNLRLMNEMELLEQFVLEDGVKFKLHCNEHNHHHHFICTSCETTYPYNFCPMGTEIIPPIGFKVMKHKFEIFGLCANCQKDDDMK